MPTDQTWLRRFLKEGGNKSSRAWLALLIFTLALQILCIWNIELSGRDSPRVAGIAREMAVTSNYLIPRLNGENFLEYPSLGYWPIALSLSMSEKPCEFLAFLPIVLLGTGTVLITFLIGKTLAGERIGLIAGFILSTTPGFVSIHRYCRVDPALLFFITLSLYGLAAGYRASKKSFLFFVVFYLATAGAFLSKGIIGAAIPIGTALVFFITQKDLKAIRRLLLSPGILLFLLPVFLWSGSVWLFEGPGIIKEVLRQSISRFFSPEAEHLKPIYFYCIPALLHLMPWILLLLVLLWYRYDPAQPREQLSHGSLLKFALVWFLTVFIGLSLASAKRPLYLGPLFPPFALLAALGWDRLREKFPKVKRVEIYGLIFIFFICTGTHLFLVIPSEKQESLRPVFDVVSSQRTMGRVYLVNASESLQGASFFYLGERKPVLDRQNFLAGRFEDRQGTILVLNVLDIPGNDRQLDYNLLLKGYHRIFRRKYGKEEVYVYSNGPRGD
jgi:4-amino-4-deoxy-L-arabinose transferase-like glycosyltransferase